MTGTGKTILVVDDEPSIARLLADLLALDGHAVETAANGAVALAKLRARAYDVILSDLKMPELDGAGLYREVTRLDAALGRRFIFVTGSALDPESRRSVEGLGVPILTKPFRVDTLRQMVQHVLSGPVTE